MAKLNVDPSSRGFLRHITILKLWLEICSEHTSQRHFENDTTKRFVRLYFRGSRHRVGRYGNGVRRGFLVQVKKNSHFKPKWSSSMRRFLSECQCKAFKSSLSSLQRGRWWPRALDAMFGKISSQGQKLAVFHSAVPVKPSPRYLLMHEQNIFKDRDMGWLVPFVILSFRPDRWGRMKVDTAWL